MPAGALPGRDLRRSCRASLLDTATRGVVIARLVSLKTTTVRRVPAPAKVNLYLDVLGALDNGYHEIRSVVAPITLCDEVLLEPADGSIELVVEGTWRELIEALPPEDNLAMRAAARLKAETGCAHGARIRLRKEIPVGGGLGGGSADAAAVLVGLNELWGTGLAREALITMGAGLGCDVPALVHGGLVCMEGMGERVAPVLQGAPNGNHCWWLVVVNPGFRVSTRDIYTRHSQSLTSRAPDYRKVLAALAEGNPVDIAAGMFNALQPTVFRKYPLIEMLVEGLKSAGAMGAMVSGSGASAFALVRDEAHGRQVESTLRDTIDYPCWSKVTRTLPDGVTVAHGPLEA